MLRPFGIQKVYSAWEPACGEGHIAEVLREYADLVIATDIHDYGYGQAPADFLVEMPPNMAPDWIITNPPFRLGEQFARHALRLMEGGSVECGVAMLVRTAFLEGVERHRLFTDHPPAVVAQFAERVPMVKGRLDRTASTATSYAWIVWARGKTDTRLRWIPPCRKALERDSDWPAEGLAA